ncbi:1390_t:CDS:2, partial [Funneliformis caledonium]
KGPFHKSFSAVVSSNGWGNQMLYALLFESENLDACRVDVYFEEILDL